MKRVFFASVPFWSVILLLVGAIAGMLWSFSLSRPVVVNYSLVVPGSSSSTGSDFEYGEEPKLANVDYFAEVKRTFVEQKASFIEADLSSMRLRVYADGEPAADVPILTKGKEGSWWETPAGIYKIATKEKNHFSSFGRVYQPWSMAFQGNFFIHGWPYYSNGTPVASSYSGGCIRLSDKNAKTVYDLSSVGMPVLVFKEDLAPDAFRYKARTPVLSSESYLVADARNNFVFMEKSSTEPVAFEPFSQFLGALVATDFINIEKKIVLTDEYLGSEGAAYFRSGDTVTPFDLLHTLLLRSDKASIRVFSKMLGETRFEKLVNDKSKAVGMKNSSFSLAPSAEEGEISKTTPEDLFYLGKYIYHNRRFVLDLSAGRQTNRSYERSDFADLENANIFEDESSFVGGKAAKHDDGTVSFFGVFDTPINGGTRPIFIFLSHSGDVVAEVRPILDYVKKYYK